MGTLLLIILILLLVGALPTWPYSSVNSPVKGGDGSRINFTKYGGFTFGDFVVEVKFLLVGSWFS